MKRTYMVVNDWDGNDSFEVEAESGDEAAHTALEVLGWWIAEPSEVDDEEEQEVTK